MKTQHDGRRAELLARHYLEKQGLTCLATNFNCRYGELDLIMRTQCQRIIVFVEVRYRSRSDYGGAKESVNLIKQRKLVRSAQWYLKLHRLENLCARIDVIAISSLTDSISDIEWIQNAIEE